MKTASGASLSPACLLPACRGGAETRAWYGGSLQTPVEPGYKLITLIANITEHALTAGREKIKKLCLSSHSTQQ